MPETRRLFIKNMAALVALGATGAAAAEIGPTKLYTLTEEEELRASASAVAETLVSIPHLLRYLDACGAEFSAIAGRPGWYQVAWYDPDLGDSPKVWACSVEPSHFDCLYARTFRAKVEGWDKF